MGSNQVLPVLLLLLCSLMPAAMSYGFTCAGNRTSTCQAMVGYVPPNATAIAAVQTLFGIKHLRSILGANNLPLSTPANTTVGPNQTIKIPFNCSCSNGTGASYHRPTHTVRSGDTLSHLATDIFANLVTYEDIQAANNISNPNLIIIGQKLYIPLPCSCDDVTGSQVVHYGHVVAAGSSVAEIAAQFDVPQDTLMALNGIADAKDLMAGQVLDVPLKACASMIRNNSLDSSLLVANGSSVFTANNCVKCSCDSANNWTLQCEPSTLTPSNWSVCPSMQCVGTELYIGNRTSDSCNATTCAYAGYTNQSILTTLETESTCPAPSNYAAKEGLQVLCWSCLLMFALFLQCLLYV